MLKHPLATWLCKGHITMYTVLFQIFKSLYSLVPYCLTQSHLSTAQASSSFKWLHMCTSTSTTPTFISEVFRLVTHAQLLITTVTVN